ncbi:MAG: glycosyltransferase family 39 protein [Chloroflexota bacterium]|nr:glycosyltransferase family 39 protein [Chloroflexota bacterium]
MSFLKRLFSASYLYALEPGPWGGLFPVYVALAVVFATGAGACLFWLRRRRSVLSPLTRALLTAEGLICTTGLGFTVARFARVPVLSARVWPFAAVLSAGGVGAVYLLARARPGDLIGHQLRLLALRFDADEGPWPPAGQIALALAHLIGMGMLWSWYRRPWALALPSLAVLLLPQVIPQLVRRERVRLYLEGLTPLFIAYAAMLWYNLFTYLLGVDLARYEWFPYPDPWSATFDVDAAVWAGVGYALLVQAKMAVVWLGRRERELRILGASVLALTLLWAGAEYLGHRTRGVTGSDPFCYAQMAVDLARTGSPLHRFPLAQSVGEAGLSVWPAVHVGYHPPFDERGTAATVWPIGGALPLAAGYLVLGEEGLYVTTPLIALLSLMALALLAVEVVRHRPAGERWLVMGLAAFLLATSPEQVDRVLVPMADATAQLLTTLTVLCALRARRGRAWLWGTLAGLAFGTAYWVRHTQLLLVVPLLLAALWGERRWRRGLAFLLPCAVAALAVALPDLAYHHFVFGSVLTPESPEAYLFGVEHVGHTALLMLDSALRRAEFGFVVLFIGYGAHRLARENRRGLAVLLSTVAAVLAIHLPYAPLRWRDLLSIVPLLALLAAYGTVALTRRLWELARSASGGDWLRVVMVALALMALSVRTRPVLASLFAPRRASFGYVYAQQRRAFDELAVLVPEDAVVGSTLNGGAVELYTGREAIHPAPWTADEFVRFVHLMATEGRAVYLLDDGVEMQPVLETAREWLRMSEAGELFLPYYLAGGDSRDRFVILYLVQP